MSLPSPKSEVIHNSVQELLCKPQPPVMKKVILTPNMAVNMKKLLNSGFFAVIASLCGLLMGSAGCSAPTKIFHAGKAAGVSLIGTIQSWAPGTSSSPVQQKISPGLLKTYPRTVHPQFLARLDAERKPLDENSTEWDIALYHAIKPTSQDFSYLPAQVRDISGENFGALHYNIAAKPKSFPKHMKLNLIPVRSSSIMRMVPANLWPSLTMEDWLKSAPSGI